jgi:DNA polymerase-3 subunit alpha
MDSLIKPLILFEKTKELGQSSVAVTDHSSLAAAWDSLKASEQTGVKLIMGCEFNFVDDVSNGGKIRHIILLAKNHEGYKNLLKLGKLANDNNIISFNKATPRIDWKLLEAHSAGLICTTACSGGILGQLINTRRIDEARIQGKRLKEIFSDSLAFEIQPHAMFRNASPYNDYDDQMHVNNILIDLADELNVKVIAATDAHYVSPEDWEMHDALLSIGSGVPVKASARLKYTVNDFYMKTRDQVVKFFARYYGDRAEEFCDNTLYFSSMCEEPKWIDPKYSNPSGKELPEFHVKNQTDYGLFCEWLSTKDSGFKSKKEDVLYLKYLCEQYIDNIKHNISNIDEFTKRVDKELDVFEYKDLSSYMLIVSDYISWAKNNGIPVGPGRGSVGGSLVAYLLGIHEADPIKYGLVFERFYNKLKVGMSDIDVDFSKAGKSQVEKYIASKYGEDYCAKVSSYSTLTPKPYVRNIAKAFKFGGSTDSAIEIGNNIADSIPKEITTVSTAFEYVPLLAEYAKKYVELKKFADSLGNINVSYSTHAGAIVIGKRPLVDIVPLRRSKDNHIVIEYEKDQVENNGLVKMDILGVSTLDIIDETFKLIKGNGKEPPKLPWNYDDNDNKTYDLIGSGNTYGVFQLGKAGAANLCVEMKPKNIEDLAMINSMIRPGFPKDVRSDFIKSKKDGTICNVIHPSLKNSLEPTFGFALFDEVLLNLAKDVAGWDLDEADRLRKFVKEKGKSKEKDRKLKADFIAGTIRSGIEREMANKIWDEVLSNFGEYIFNKSHAVAYSFLAYQTAYLKAHFPVEFLICNLIHEDVVNTQSSEDNKVLLKKEIRTLGVKILPPNIDRSSNNYIISNNNTILTGLNSLKYMGKDAIPEILEHRPFNSFDDLLSRVDARKVRVTAIQAMAASGCLDHFGLTRKQIFLYSGDYKKKLQVWNKKHPGEPFVYPWPEDIGEWAMAEKYAMEEYYIGEGLSCNLREAYPGFFDHRALRLCDLAELFPEPDDKDKFEKCVIPASAGIVECVIKTYFEFKIKKETSKLFGKTMARVDIEDPYGNTSSMAIFPAGLELFNERLRILTGNKVVLEPGIAVYCEASVSWYEGNVSLIFENLSRVAPIPPRPKDLKARKVSMRITAASKSRKKTNKIDPDDLLEQIEDELIEEGHSE